MAEASDRPADLDYADTLWKSADTLRGQVDAAEYRCMVPPPFIASRYHE